MAYLLTLAASGLVTWLLLGLATRQWRRTTDEHWTVQAKALYPVQVSRQLYLWAIPVIATLALDVCGIDRSWVGIAACSYIGVLLANFPTDRAINPQLGFGVWAHEVFAGSLVRLAGALVYFAAGWIMPRELNLWAAAIALGCLGFQIAWHYGLGLRLMRGLRLLVAPPERVVSLVSEMSESMKTPVRAVWELASCGANAIAFVITRELAFTRRIIALCPDDQLKAICAHELGHLSEGRWTGRGRLVGALVFFPLIFVKPAGAMEDFVGYALIALVMGLLWFGRLKLSQRMEKRADLIACDNTVDPRVYALALEALHRDNLMPAVMPKKSFQTHPDLYERMVSAGLNPDYPRPAPPADQHWTSMLTTALATLLVMYRFVG